MQTESTSPADFLGRCEVIDCDDPAVLELARQLKEQSTSTHDLVDRCFRWVRDEIRHSGDHQLSPVTCSASEVLHHRTGFCYAKSHLLVALLRANKIPSGLAYQRLAIDESGAAHCVHGLCAVHLKGDRWYRIDPRGNRDDIDAQFAPPEERLAFSPSLPGEYDVPGVFREPLTLVTDALLRYETWDSLLANAPDLPEADLQEENRPA